MTTVVLAILMLLAAGVLVRPLGSRDEFRHDKGPQPASATSVVAE